MLFLIKLVVGLHFGNRSIIDLRRAPANENYLVVTRSAFQNSLTALYPAEGSSSVIGSRPRFGYATVTDRSWQR